jgi:hypothetical protein
MMNYKPPKTERIFSAPAQGTEDVRAAGGRMTHSRPLDHTLGASLFTLSLKADGRQEPHAPQNSTILPYLFFVLTFSVLRGLQVGQGAGSSCPQTAQFTVTTPGAGGGESARAGWGVGMFGLFFSEEQIER